MFNRFLKGIIHVGAIVAIFSVLATGMYYLMPVTDIGLLLCAALAVLCGFFLWKKSEVDDSPALTKASHSTFTPVIASCVSFVSLGVFWFELLTHPVTTSVRSPWLVFSPGNLFWLAIPVVCVGILAARKELGAAAFAITAATLFSALSVAAALYPLGYGFDPFLHRATVLHIAEHGTITPKPLYYIGQYVIELFALKIVHLPLNLVDAYLTPFLAALLIPAAVFLRDRKELLLFLPLAALIQTTPQALAFMFTVVAVLAPKNMLLKGAFALGAFAAHPLAGIFAVLYVLMDAVATKDRPLKKYLLSALTLMAALALPAAFTLESLLAHFPVTLHFPTILTLASLPLNVFVGTRWNMFGDTAYLIIGNAFWIVFAFALITIIALVRSGKYATRDFVPAIMAGTALINFFLLGLFFDFPFLISYERMDFTSRMLTVAIIFFLPYLEFPKILREGDVSKKAFAVIMAGVMFTANAYGALPRHDAYASSAAFNVTQADIDAVKKIDEYAAGRDYVVLANQATSSAAISTLGFKKYYHGDVFFYPIPTGGPLYQLYLDMAKTPNLTTIEKVREITGAQFVFFVMDDYWWDSARVIEQTKTIANEQWAVGNRAVTVSVFN